MGDELCLLNEIAGRLCLFLIEKFVQRPFRRICNQPVCEVSNNAVLCTLANAHSPFLSFNFSGSKKLNYARCRSKNGMCITIYVYFICSLKYLTTSTASKLYVDNDLYMFPLLNSILLFHVSSEKIYLVDSNAQSHHYRYYCKYAKIFAERYFCNLKV